MKALQIQAPGSAALIDVPVPIAGRGEVLVKVLAVTTCPQWDLHIMAGEPMFPDEPITYPLAPGQPGHEIAGRVLEIGPGVTDLAPGDMIAAWRDPGLEASGGYAEFVVRHHNDLLRIPDGLTADQVAPLELAMCVRVAFEALERNASLNKKRFGVSGAGPAGLLAIQMARSAGASEVIAFDPSIERRMHALQVGATSAQDPTNATQANRNTAPELDLGIDCAGRRESVQFLMGRTREAVALFGILREPVWFGWEHFSGLSLLGYGTHHREAAEWALTQIQNQALDLTATVSMTLPLSEYHSAVKLLGAQEALKICFQP
jgi:threonine 3-dehydrogenase